MVHLLRLMLGLLFLLTLCTIAFGVSKFQYTWVALCGGLVAVFCYAIGFIIQDLCKGRFNL